MHRHRLSFLSFSATKIWRIGWSPKLAINRAVKKSTQPTEFLLLLFLPFQASPKKILISAQKIVDERSASSHVSPRLHSTLLSVRPTAALIRLQLKQRSRQKREEEERGGGAKKATASFVVVVAAGERRKERGGEAQHAFVHVRIGEEGGVSAFAAV